MGKNKHLVEDREDQRYVVGDAIENLRDLNGRASLIYLDDAWDRPYRAEQFGVTYPTHSFEQTKEILGACKEALKPGGWLIADADDWLLPKLIEHLKQEWGDVVRNYEDGGYRRVGGVTYLTKDNEPDCSTPGAYLTSGGYPVVFAHKGETQRVTDVSARQIAQKPREQFGWGSIKPIKPYQEWLRGLYDPSKGGMLVVPCAGTAPAAIAAEKLYTEGVYDTRPQFVCIDSEEGAYEAFETRWNTEIEGAKSGASD